MVWCQELSSEKKVLMKDQLLDNTLQSAHHRRVRVGITVAW